MPTSENGWTEWGKFVLKELERQNDNQEAMNKTLNELTTEIAMLKLKSGLWGFAAGAIPAAAIIVARAAKLI